MEKNVTRISDAGWGGDAAAPPPLLMCSPAELRPRWIGWSCQSGRTFRGIRGNPVEHRDSAWILRRPCIVTHPSFYPLRISSSISQRSSLSGPGGCRPQRMWLSPGLESPPFTAPHPGMAIASRGVSQRICVLEGIYAARGHPGLDQSPRTTDTILPDTPQSCNGLSRPKGQQNKQVMHAA